MWFVRRFARQGNTQSNGVSGQKVTIQFSFKYGWVMASINLWKITSDCKLKFLSKKWEFFRIWNLVIGHTVKRQILYQQIIPLCVSHQFWPVAAQGWGNTEQSSIGACRAATVSGRQWRFLFQEKSFDSQQLLRFSQHPCQVLICCFNQMLLGFWLCEVSC